MPTGLKSVVKQGFLFIRDLAEPLCNFQEVSILCYHSVSDVPFITNVTAQEFDAHLNFLSGLGHIFVSLSDIEEWRHGRRVLPRKAVALTFDDGYADFETTVVPLVKKYNAPVALFMVGDVERSRKFLGSENTFLSPDALDRLRQDPLIEIGYHSRSHPSLETLTLGDLVEEIKRPAGERYFAYPGGHYSADVVDAIKAEGYAAAYSIKPTLVSKTSDTYLLPRHVIGKNTPPWELRFATTRACQWYRALWRWSKCS